MHSAHLRQPGSPAPSTTPPARSPLIPAPGSKQQGEQTALNFPFQRNQQATNIYGGLASGTPTTPGVPLTTDPRVAAMTGIGSLAGPSIPFSNVLGDVVKGAGTILSDIFRGSGTPTGGGIFGGYGSPTDYYRSTSRGGGDIYGSEGSF